MKILALGDSHGNVPFLEDACRMANRLGADRIFQVGDWGYLWPGRREDRLKAITNVLDQFDQQMFFIDGNHDWFDQLERLGAPVDAPEPVALSHNVTYMSRGLTWEWDGVSFMSLGGAYSIDQEHRTPWTSWWPNELLRYADTDRAIAAGHVDVMLTHDAPDGITRLDAFLVKSSEYLSRSYAASWYSKLEPGSTAHRKTLRGVVDEVQPDLLVHGHYHWRYDCPLVGDGYVTEVIGLDCDGTGEKAWVVIDTDEVAAMRDGDG
jgi:predicted phosphodiesterase